MKTKNILHMLPIFLFGVLHMQGQAVYDGSSKHTFTTNYGKIEIGPFNYSYGHIYTDRPKIIFNKPVWTAANIFSSYNNDLILQTEGSTRLVIDDDSGFVGIGTSTPDYPLHVVSGSRTEIKIGGPSTSNGAVSDLIFAPNDDGKIGDSYYWDWSFRTDSWAHAPGDLVLYSNNGSGYTSPIIVQADGDVALVTGNGAARKGNVGIGTNDPDAKLAVNGDIHAQEVKVDLTVLAPDYVFKEGYKLRTLEETQNYIDEHGHLPNIPSAREMEENGILVGEMNMKLLEKIEELTLHTIQQEKQLKNKDKEIKWLKERTQRQEERLDKIEKSINRE